MMRSFFQRDAKISIFFFARDEGRKGWKRGEDDRGKAGLRRLCLFCRFRQGINSCVHVMNLRL
jgi:hypothetical protein